MSARPCPNRTKTTEGYLALVPTFAALPSCVCGIRLVHDDIFSPQRTQALETGLADAGVSDAGLKPVRWLSVILVDSNAHPRIQIADLLAGTARMVAADALAGGASPLIIDLRPSSIPVIPG